MPARYRELAPPPELAHAVACTWERDVPDGASSNRVLPDGCLDLVWYGEGPVAVAGPDRQAVVHTPPPGARIVGVRLRPGWAATVLGLPAHEICDRRVPLPDLWRSGAGELSHRLHAAADTPAAYAALVAAVARRLRDAPPPDALVLAAVAELGRPGSRVGTISRRLAVSERHLRRRFLTAVGYGPKTLDRVLRLQRFVARSRATAEGGGLAALAAELGYADQAHLSRDCGRLAGLSPRRLTAEWGGAPSS